MSNQSYSVILKNKIRKFNKIIIVDSDKSISIRSFLIGSISQGISKVFNVLESDDVFSTIESIKKLNFKIKKIGKKNYQIYGKGLGSYYAQKNTKLNLGNSGTGLRLLSSIIATTPNIEVVLTGDQSLKKRNMSKLISLMNEFGAEFYPKNKVFLPLKIISSDMPIGIKFNSGVSSQIKSACILSGLNSFGKTTIIEKIRSRDHTEKMVSNSPNVIKIKNSKDKREIKIIGKSHLEPFNIKIPGDPSSAAFFIALTLLVKNSSLKIKNVGLNPTRIGFLDIMKKAGGKIKFKNIKNKKGEPFGDIHIKSSKLKPLRVTKKFYVRCVDEFPIIFVISAMIHGISILEVDAENLKNKESDRIIEMKKILKQIGIKCIVKNNKIKIFGNPNVKNLDKKINVPNLHDHRICMSSFMLGLLGFKAVIKSFNTQVNSSSPNFLRIVRSLGAKYEIKKN